MYIFAYDLALCDTETDFLCGILLTRVFVIVFAMEINVQFFFLNLFGEEVVESYTLVDKSSRSICVFIFLACTHSHV